MTEQETNTDKINMTDDEKVIEHLRSCDKHPERVSMYTFDNAIECIKQLRKERDAARREVCHWSNTDESGCVKYGSEETAISRGWDCFKEESK